MRHIKVFSSILVLGVLWGCASDAHTPIGAGSGGGGKADGHEVALRGTVEISSYGDFGGGWEGCLTILEEEETGDWFGLAEDPDTTTCPTMNRYQDDLGAFVAVPSEAISNIEDPIISEVLHGEPGLSAVVQFFWLDGELAPAERSFTSGYLLCRAASSPAEVDNCHNEMFYKSHLETYYGADMYVLDDGRAVSAAATTIADWADVFANNYLHGRHAELLGDAEYLALVVEDNDMPYYYVYAFDVDAEAGSRFTRVANVAADWFPEVMTIESFGFTEADLVRSYDY